MTIAEEKAQPYEATIVDGPTHPARSQRRRSRRKVATWAVACSAVVLAAGGYLAVHKSSEPGAARARSADSARLQAQADAHATRQAATAQARSADSARLQAQADAHAAQLRGGGS